MENDKFILIGLEDSRSKDVAEVLGNKTCKKILNFLAETKEASEKDIADNLKIPINTAEYNLRKLVKSGLVEKTKNFFWSRKGKKIEMYKLTRKHIIISPNKKFDINNLKAILPVLFVAFAVIALVLYIDFNNYNQRVVLEDSLKMESSPQETQVSAAGSKAVPSAEEINYDYENLKFFEFELRDGILIFIEVILVLSIVISIFLLVRRRYLIVNNKNLYK